MRLADVEAVFALVQECRDLWADARAWQAHLLEGACRLTGTAVGFYNEVRVSREGRRCDVLDESDFGWRDGAARSCLVRMYVDYPDRAAYMPRITRLAAAAPDTDCVALLRGELRSDPEWRKSDMLNRYRRPAFLDDMIIAFRYNPHTGSTILLCTNQDVADRPPTRRGKAILRLLTRQVAPLVGTSLVTGSQAGLHDLSPRLRQTLEALLAGHGEKQVAAHLGISRATVHEYIGDLYNRFDVEGRAALMAYFLGRRPRSGRANGRHELQPDSR